MKVIVGGLMENGKLILIGSKHAYCSLSLVKESTSDVTSTICSDTLTDITNVVTPKAKTTQKVRMSSIYLLTLHLVRSPLHCRW